MKNLRAVLEAAGSSLQNVVKVNVFITDMANFMAMNEGYAQLFPEPYPVHAGRSAAVRFYVADRRL